MFRKSRTIINGVELPEEFSGASIINNVAISPNGDKYAYVTGKNELITGTIPEDGKIKTDKGEITYQRKGTSSTFLSGFNMMGQRVNSQVIINGVNTISSGGRTTIMSGGSISVSGGSINISSDNGLEYDIDESYKVASGDEINLESKNEELELRVNQSEEVRVIGKTASEPKYKNGKLLIDDLKGILYLPAGITNLELAIETKNGSVTGEIIHPGKIESKNGSIRLQLYSPLTVDTLTKNGSVNVRGMLSEGDGKYLPPSEESTGKLSVSTKNGDISLIYTKK